MYAKKKETTLSVVQTTTSLLEKALTVLQEGICIIDENARILYINDALLNILKVRIGKMPAHRDSIFDFIPEDRRPAHREALEKALNGLRSFFEFSYVNRKEEHWVELEYCPMNDESSGQKIICLRTKDITESVILKKKFQAEQKNQQNRIIKATIDAEDKQRGQIGRELHDNVNQVLTTIKLYAELCLKEGIDKKELLEQIVKRANYCIEEIRNLSRRLTSPSIEEQSLEDLIQNLVESVRATQKIIVRFRSSGIRGKVLKQDVQTAIYRIAQEQLTNILKYAEATIVDIILVHINQVVAMQIQDNGKGFIFEADKKTSGLTNMISRAESVGGKIEFDTAPEKGCTVTAEFPL